jgi:hypothetical protein
MSYNATVFNVLIASPGDVQEERRIAREIALEWNSMHARSRKVVLMPRGWDRDAYSSMGGRPQGELNKQIVDDADLLIAIFGTRVGTPTGEAEGGSIEELTRHMETGKPTMVFQSFVPADPRLFVTDQYKKLTEFIETWAKPRGVLWTYQSHEEFRSQISRQLTTMINDDPYFKPARATSSIIGSSSSLLQMANRLRNGEDLEAILVVPDLGPEAKALLVEASQDKNGIIISSRTMSGHHIETNGKDFVRGADRRSAAVWEGALEDLLRLGMVRPRGVKGEVFELTREGYKAADAIRSHTLTAPPRTSVPMEGEFLSKDAITLLTEVALDSDGLILHSEKANEASLNTHGKEFINKKYPRSRSQWEAALKMLVGRNLVAEVDDTEGMYVLTDEGRDLAKELRP